MPTSPKDSKRFPISPHEADQLECPRCRRLAEANGHRGFARCAACGARLVPSARSSEALAWRQLYGGPPRHSAFPR